MLRDANGHARARASLFGPIVRTTKVAIVAVLCAFLTVAIVTTSAATAAAATPSQLYNDAQVNFVRGDATGGLGKISDLLNVSPGDVDALALQAIWADYAGDFGRKVDALNRLGAANPGMRAGVDNLLRSIATAAFTPPNPFPSFQGPQTAIVVLGYGLLPGGVLRPELVHRLQAAFVQAITAPMSPIIVTGGNPVNGITEAAAMQAWFQRSGIPANRIHAEHRAGSTVQNALFSTKLIRSIGANSAVVVTSANHIRRATVDFNVAGIPVVGAMSTVNQLLPELLPLLNKTQQRSMYVDATRVFGLPAAR